ncbi:phosphoribosylformylglycinamidine synthase subunit PurS [Klugiella xanthotipulae]|uniref:Phosphoribosylformylglycinamidine synthase subunit PurS n=1 Tax=Klugiella xanthotipulae TaxID=244735 RepID=A0A543HH71_9MICO|nr:phosphoribosylformylglycinamidine synthase subunit PurS [Klugiella xanthotipulae]TQM57671.1 phosphoribosylformylglycinamidine synthase [Klugiella xanthotipulae]
MPTIVVDVMPKAELLDPQGKAVTGALNRLSSSRESGSGISEVRIGKRFELTVEGPVTEELRERVREIAADILSNSVIEDVVNIDFGDDAS